MSADPGPFPERRELTLEDRRKIENIEADIDELTDRQDALTRQQADLAQRFAEAFPGGDHVGHCRYHTLMIEEIEERKRLRMALTEKVAGATLLALIFFVLTAIGYYVLFVINRGHW